MEFTCSLCGLTCCGKPIGRAALCEDCFLECYSNSLENKDMTFTEAIQKYDKITNDGGKTCYCKDSLGDIFQCNTNHIVNANIDFLLSTGWEEYKDEELVLPTFIGSYNKYYTISDIDEVYAYKQRNDSIDASKLKVYKYFTDKCFAQYVADKQFIQRVELTLIELNKYKFSEEELKKLINKYLRDNHIEVLDRIITYESL